MPPLGAAGEVLPPPGFRFGTDGRPLGIFTPGTLTGGTLTWIGPTETPTEGVLTVSLHCGAESVTWMTPRQLSDAPDFRLLCDSGTLTAPSSWTLLACHVMTWSPLDR